MIHLASFASNLEENMGLFVGERRPSPWVQRLIAQVRTSPISSVFG